MAVGFIRSTFIIGASLTWMAAQAAGAGDFVLTSTNIQEGKDLPALHFANDFGCSGGNTSPQLSWANPPAGTKSYVVTAFDLDEHTGSGWWHWVVANIPASVTQLSAGAGAKGGAGLPAGAMPIENDSREAWFQGACPEEGERHRYVFTVRALKVDKLDLPANASPAMVTYMAYLEQLGEAKITAWGGR